MLHTYICTNINDNDSLPSTNLDGPIAIRNLQINNEHHRHPLFFNERSLFENADEKDERIENTFSTEIYPPPIFTSSPIVNTYITEIKVASDPHGAAVAPSWNPVTTTSVSGPRQRRPACYESFIACVP